MFPLLHPICRAMQHHAVDHEAMRRVAIYLMFAGGGADPLLRTGEPLPSYTAEIRRYVEEWWPTVRDERPDAED